MGSPATPPPPQQHRPARKVPGTRSWLILEGSSGGNPHVEELGKHAIMRRTGLLTRDLRILDPLLSYPSTILGRERAIVIKLEHIKAVVTAHEVLVQNPRDPLVASFVRDLTLRLASASGAAGAAGAAGASAPSPVGVPQNMDGNGANATASTVPISSNPVGSFTNLDAKNGGASALPFEFIALEASLKYACRYLESEASTLEEEAYPALDALTSKISTLQLERVRQIKSRLVQVSGRVQKVRDELENLLDDDMDMEEMYLTEKLNRHEVDEVCMDSDSELGGPDEGDENLTSKGRESVRSFNYSPNIQDLEMLLEAYFVQIEGTLNKLSALREYVDDTEDYINIMLDDKQNQLLQMAVMLSTATMLVNAGVAVVSTFGMNIEIDLYQAAPRKFWETTIGVVISILVLFVVALTWGKRKGLLSS